MGTQKDEMVAEKEKTKPGREKSKTKSFLQNNCWIKKPENIFVSCAWIGSSNLELAWYQINLKVKLQIQILNERSGYRLQAVTPKWLKLLIALGFLR